MSYYVDVQHACQEIPPVTDQMLTEWATTAIKPYRDSAELTVRLVDAKEITTLNHTYRKKNKPTNVLAFPAVYPDDIELEFPLLGDIIICSSVLKQESEEQDKPLVAHWAHIVIHGVLHLLGYDHIKESEALKMQAIEIGLLAKLGFDNPYKSKEEDA
jgi:probable rRNA maturation factor